MKKLFFLATVAVALVLAGCSKGINSLPKELREVIKEADEEMKEQFEDIDEIDYKGVEVDGKDIIFTMQLTEEALDGESLKSAAKKEGMTKETLKASFIYGVRESDGQEELADLLKEHKYNIVIRMIGKDKDDKIEAKISYKDL